METRASYLLVGSFMLALMATSVVFVIWITGSKAEKPVRYFMQFSGSVTGLQVGSQVRFRGIPVGEVVTIDIVENKEKPDGPVAIEVVIDIREDTPIRESTRSVLEIQGITGVSFVQLVSEPGPSTLLKPSTKKNKVYIATKASSIEKIFKNFPELLAELTALASQGRKLLSDDNIDRIGNTFTNIDQFTKNIASESGDFSALIAEGRKALEAATPALNNLSEAADKFATTAPKLTAAADGVLSAADTVEDAAAELSVLVKTNQQPLADFAATGLYDISQFFVEARQLVAGLLRLSKKLERDPARFLFGDQQRGYDAR